MKRKFLLLHKYKVLVKKLKRARTGQDIYDADANFIEKISKTAATCSSNIEEEEQEKITKSVVELGSEKVVSIITHDRTSGITTRELKFLYEDDEFASETMDYSFTVSNEVQQIIKQAPKKCFAPYVLGRIMGALNGSRQLTFDQCADEIGELINRPLKKMAYDYAKTEDDYPTVKIDIDGETIEMIKGDGEVIVNFYSDNILLSSEKVISNEL